MVLKSKLAREALIFGAVGVTATAGYAAGVWLLVSWANWAPETASAAAYVVCAIFSFTAHSLLTFGLETGRGAAAWRFALTTAVGLIVATGAMKAISLMRLPVFVGIVIVVVAIPLTNFIILKYWVFRNR